MNDGISVSEACKSAYKQLTESQQANCPGVDGTSEYMQYSAIPVVAILILVVILIVVYARK